MKKLRLALDWTVNTNHSGFVVAKEKGFYAAEQLEVQISTPAEDNYSLTPMKKLELGQTELALCPMESILSYRTKSIPFLTKAIGTVFQQDLSAVVTLDRPDVKSPRDLDGLRYASYKAKYEDMIIQEMVKNDGGKGEIELLYPEKLGIWETLLSKKADATWIFSNWEGVEAQMKGHVLKSFRLGDFGIPYGYSPVIATSEEHLLDRKEDLRKFMEASRQGFLFAQKFPEETARILIDFVTAKDQDLWFLTQSQNFTNPYYGEASDLGKMDPANVDAFLAWLYEKGLETRRFSSEEVIENLL